MAHQAKPDACDESLEECSSSQRPSGEEAARQNEIVNQRRRELIYKGIDDFNAHRLQYYIPLLLSICIVVGTCSVVGHAFDRSTPASESVGAGVGLLVGLVLWLALVTWFICRGGGAAVRDRRIARRRDEHINAIKRRRSQGK
jgi:hypothetical protein